MVVAKLIKSFRGPYSFLSNFYCSPMTIDGQVYHSVEGYFQSMKCINPDDQEITRKLRSPLHAKRYARCCPIRLDWDYVKQDVMYRALCVKFSNPHLRERLLRTGTATLMEGNTWHDNYWGSCVCAKCGNSGRNELGKLLMQVRSEISEINQN